MPSRKLVTVRNLLTSIALSFCSCDCNWSLGESDTDATGGAGDDDGLVCAYEVPCDGVKVWCNNGAPPQADDTADGDGGDERNYWWTVCEGTPPNSGCNPGDEHCCAPDLSVCYCKTYEQPGPANVGDVGLVCVGPDWPADEVGFDPLADWQNTNDPYSDEDVVAAIRSQCSAICQGEGDPAAGLGGFTMPKCVAEDWSGLQTLQGWSSSQGFNCPVAFSMNQDDPTGYDVPWQLVGGTAHTETTCDLNDDCFEEFFPSVRPYITRPHADFIDLDSSSAQYLGIEGTGSELEIDTPWGSGAGSDDTEPLVAWAEYSAPDCDGPDACPFYLANLTAYGPSTWEIVLITDEGRIAKTVQDVQFDLVQSTLGVLEPSLGKVAFAPGSLRLHVSATVSSCGTCDDFGDGPHATVMHNVDYVFADYDDGELTLEHGFPFQSTGTATLSLHIVPDEHPPAAAHDLQAVELCDALGGKLLIDATRSTSSDPDGDIVSELWMVDGNLVGESSLVPVGSHLVSLVVEDGRGAMDRTEPQWVYVSCPTSP